MWLLLGMFFMVLMMALCFLDHKSKQRINFKQNVRVWSKQQSSVLLIGIIVVAATWVIWSMDTHDLEVTCNKGMCFQTNLQVIHKVGLFGFAPKFFRSYVEPFAFNVEDNYLYRIEEETCKVGKNTEKTSYNIYLHNGEGKKIKTRFFCDDAVGAHELNAKLVACLHKEACHVVVESGYWEEIGCGVLVIILFYIMFFQPNIEYLILDDTEGTVEILQESLLGYSLMHAITLATTITETAFVKTHTKKDKSTYSLEVCLKGKDHSILRQRNRVKVEQIAQDLNRFVCEWNTKIKAENNFVKLKYECVICFDDSVSTMLLPCAHACVCDDCSGEIHSCPLCRKEIKQRKRIFFDTS